MRKFTALILTAALLFSLTACSSAKKNDTKKSDEAEKTASLEQIEEKNDPALSENDAEETVETFSGISVDLPAGSTEFSMLLASEALTLCTGHQQDKEAKLLTDAGFEILAQSNYDKTPDDPSHTCAYSIGRKQVTYNGAERTLIIAAVRGTDAGEWYSNFDFASSGGEAAVYAENFLACAEDVYAGMEGFIAAAEEPLILVCGHSRGAACANLLGLLLNRQMGTENVFVYTFATPTTFRGGIPDTDCSNIFNVINPADIVPLMPLPGWGYGRLGQDVILPGNSELAETVSGLSMMMWSIAPTITQYYTQRHSLTGPGLSEDGLTTFELMNALTASLLKGETEQSEGFDSGAISQDSDFYPVIQSMGLLQTMGLSQHMPLTYQALMAAKAAVSVFLPTE